MSSRPPRDPDRSKDRPATPVAVSRSPGLVTVPVPAPIDIKVALPGSRRPRSNSHVHDLRQSARHAPASKKVQAGVNSSLPHRELSSLEPSAVNGTSSHRLSTKPEDGLDTPRPGQLFKLDGHASPASHRERSSINTKTGDFSTAVEADIKRDPKTHLRARHSTATVGSKPRYSRQPSISTLTSSSGSLLSSADIPASLRGKENTRDRKISSTTARDRRPSAIDVEKAQASLTKTLQKTQSMVVLSPRSLAIYDSLHQSSSSTSELTAKTTATSIVSIVGVHDAVRADMARLSSATMGDHAPSSSSKNISATKQGKGSTDQYSMEQSSVLPAKGADDQRVHKHVRVSSESSAVSARSSSASSNHPAFVATLRPPSDASACSFSGASEGVGRSSGGSVAEWQQMLQKRGLTPAKKLPRPLTAASQYLDVPQSATISKHSSTSTSRSSLVAHIADANSQFPTPPNHSPSTLKDERTGHHVPQRANSHSLVLTDDAPASTVTAPEPATPRPRPPSKATVPAPAPVPAAAALPALANVLKTRSSPIMGNSSWLEDGTLASATISDAIAYFTGFPGLLPGSRPPLASDADTVRAIWVAWRHHVGSREFFACVRRLYKHWSRLAPSGMDAFVDQLCSWWFDHWMVVDEEIVDDVRAFIQDIGVAQPDQAAWLTNAFNKRKLHLVLRSDMSALVVPDAVGSEHTAESDAPSVYRFLGEFMDSAAGRDEFASQLTVVFNAIYESLPHPLMLTLDWYLNGDEEQYLPLENTLLSLHEDLLKWVAKSIMGAVDGASLVKVVAFWMDIGRRCLDRQNMTAALAIHSGLSAKACEEQWLPYEEQLLADEVGRIGFASFLEQKRLWNEPGGYTRYIVAKCKREDRAFVPHLPLHRTKAAALRKKETHGTALGWSVDGQIILDVALLRKLAEQARVLEWGYRRSGHTGNRQALEWIKLNLLAARDFRVPDVFVYATWLERRVEHKRVEKPNPTTPFALLQPHLPPRSATLARSQSVRSTSTAKTASRHGVSASM